jgi:hypothetical protein
MINWSSTCHADTKLVQNRPHNDYVVLFIFAKAHLYILILQSAVQPPSPIIHHCIDVSYSLDLY